MKRDGTYPNEGFIEDALNNIFKNKSMPPQEIEAAFKEEGEKANYISKADKVFKEEDCIWIIEAKGETSQIGLDFRTGLGQLLHKMSEKKKANIKYALAFPDENRFHKQALMVPQRIRKTLNLYFIAVNKDGCCRIIKPEDDMA